MIRKKDFPQFFSNFKDFSIKLHDVAWSDNGSSFYCRVTVNGQSSISWTVNSHPITIIVQELPTSELATLSIFHCYNYEQSHN